MHVLVTIDMARLFRFTEFRDMSRVWVCGGGVNDWLLCTVGYSIYMSAKYIASKNAIKKALKKMKNKANKKKWKNRGDGAGSKTNESNTILTGKDKIINEKIYQTMKQFLKIPV